MESKQALTGSMSAWQSNSKTRNNLDFRNASQEQRLQLIRQATAFSGHDFFLLVSACLDGLQISDNELIDVTKAFVETHCSMDHMPSMNESSGAFSDWDWISMLFDRLPEKAMRRLLRARELGLPEGDLSTLESPETDTSTDEATTSTHSKTDGGRT